MDGAGPEHSSARIERFLQLTDAPLPPAEPAGRINMAVLNLTTPANYFHALRRQMVRPFRKPLVIATPKTLLRDSRAVSALADMAPGTRFRPVLVDAGADSNDAAITRVLFCSGKVRAVSRLPLVVLTRACADLLRAGGGARQGRAVGRGDRAAGGACAVPRRGAACGAGALLRGVRVRVCAGGAREPGRAAVRAAASAGAGTIPPARCRCAVAHVSRCAQCRATAVSRAPLAASAVGSGRLHKREAEDLLARALA
jgi:hypothetical protein